MLQYNKDVSMLNAFGGKKMKKLYRYLLMTVLALCLSIPALAAEAASIALIPLDRKSVV